TATNRDGMGPPTDARGCSRRASDVKVGPRPGWRTTASPPRLAASRAARQPADPAEVEPDERPVVHRLAAGTGVRGRRRVLGRDGLPHRQPGATRVAGEASTRLDVVTVARSREEGGTLLEEHLVQHRLEAAREIDHPAAAAARDAFHLVGVVHHARVARLLARIVA